jgi:hypothetical protein
MKPRLLLLSAVLFVAYCPAFAQALPAAVQARVDEYLKVIATWAADPAIVGAVKAHNEAPPPEHLALDQDKWSKLTVLDPLVRGFTKNAAGQFLKTKKTDLVTEAFVSDAEGRKVGFLAKTTRWSHRGQPKHDVPMTGKAWQGPVELDESSGRQQLQVSVPVLAEGQPIGSLVVGLSISQLGE